MKILRWNSDKPHRCPQCHAVTVPYKPSSWAVYECCRCHAQFTRWPRLARFLPNHGVVCDVHSDDRAMYPEFYDTIDPDKEFFQ